MFQLTSDAELGICPSKKAAYYGGMDVPFTTVDLELIACDNNCPGAEPKELKIFKIIPFGVHEICPKDNPDFESLQTS